LSNNQRGIAAICGCMASYVVNDVLVKPILQSFFRLSSIRPAQTNGGNA
jgi:hypothetical protein